jgi:hypothetical protein
LALIASWLFREFHYKLFHLCDGFWMTRRRVISMVASADALRNLFVIEPRQGGTIE